LQGWQAMSRSAVAPNIPLQADIDDFMHEYPLVARDPGYGEFLETYSAAVYISPNEELAVNVFGFSEFTLHLLYPDESLVEQDRFHIFAEISLQESESAKGLLFAWDLTGEQKAGVYRSTRTSEADWEITLYTWYCKDFLTWLDALIKHKGKLF
jgi:hypothetical protein